jgi:hypothetical protein
MASKRALQIQYTTLQMEDSSVLFDLPEAVSKLIVVEWLNLQFIVRLDSALCNRKLRTLFAGLVYGHRVTFMVNGYGKRYKDSDKFDAVVSWAILRNAKLDGVYVNESKCGCNRLFPTFLATNGTALRWVASSSADISCAKQQQKLVEIARGCSHVERLYVDSKEGNFRWDDCLLLLTRAWPKLTVLSLRNVALSEEGLIAAVDQCLHLETLIIRNAEQVIPMWVISSTLKTVKICSRYVSDILLVDISQQCKQLEVLKVFESLNLTEQPLITDVGVRAILWGCPQLRETDVEFARGISNHLRVELARRRNDTSLHCLWHGMSEELVQAVLDGCPKIKDLYICPCDWLTDAALAACVRHRPQLETICVANCASVTNNSINALVSASGNRFKRITLYSCLRVGDAALKAIATHCPHLDTVIVSECPMVTDAGVAYLAVGLRDTIRGLGLCGCRKIGDKALLAVAEHCRVLGTVLLSKCPLVTDSGVVALATGLGARLRSLHLGDCPNLSDKAMLAVAEHCPLLMEFYYPPNVSGAAVDKVWERCVHLKRTTQTQRRDEDSRTLNRLLELQRPASSEWVACVVVFAAVFAICIVIRGLIRDNMQSG